MQHSVIKTLKKQLLATVLAKEPELSVELFAMAAMHGDLESLDMIIATMGNKLGNLEEMTAVRDGLADILKSFAQEEAKAEAIEQTAARETQELMKRMGL